MITPGFSPTATERVLPKLALDFTTATLDPRVTVTRALNTATRINSSGLIELVNADLPRFDYTLNTGGTCRGLLIEETRANLINYSNDVTATGWNVAVAGTGALIRTTGYGTSPQVSTAANRLQISGCSGAGNTAVVQTSTFSASAGQAITLSVYLKTNDASTKTVQINISGAAVSNVTVTGTWTRFSTTWASASAGAWNGRIGLIGGATSSDADLSLYGVQIEVGAFATSYIPTTTTSLTRNADVVQMTGTNFSSWYNASTGAIGVVFQTYAPAGQSLNVLAVQGPAGANMTLHCDNGTWRFRTNLANMNVSAGVVQNIVNNQVFCYGPSDYKFACNGTAIQTNNGVGSISGLNTLIIGGGTNYAAAKNLSGWVRRISAWPQRIINNEIVSFSK